MSENTNLTEVEFWDTYWENCKLPNYVDMNFSFERCLANALETHLKDKGISGDILEIGCAPGKWLAYMARTFSLIPYGIEYSKTGMKVTQKNLQLLGFDSGKILTGDFFQTQPDRQFDVVISLGFIEHFTDVDSVVELHLKWLKPGGIFILEVPNFSGINKLIQRILDNEILEKHNLNIMNINYFRSLLNKFNLESQFIGHIGSFEPSLFIGRDGPVNFLQRVINIFIRILKDIRKIKIIDYINSKFFSSCILAIYIKK